MKRWIAVLVMAAMLVVPAGAAGAFTDVPETHWAYEYIRDAVEYGLVDGVGDGRFAPGGEVTGAQFLTMIVRANYAGEVQDAQAGEAWYQPYVDVAAAHGLLTHGLDDMDRMVQPIDRYRMAVVLFHVLDEAGLVKRVDGEIVATDGEMTIPPEDAGRFIADWDQIPAQYQDEVLVAYVWGMMNGVDEEGTFAGERSMTRAEGATVVLRNYELFEAMFGGEQPAP